MSRRHAARVIAAALATALAAGAVPVWRRARAPATAPALDGAAQLSLAGHRHDLELITMPAPGPILNVVAGSGAEVRRERRGNARQVFREARLGFACVDLVSRDGADHLVVSLFAMERYPLLQGSAPHLVARWSVDRNGRLRDELGA